MPRFKLTGLWRHPDFMKLWVGQTISAFGSMITRDGLPYTAVLVLAASPTQMGYLVAVGSAPVLLIGLLAGVWVDRLYRRPILIAADLGRALLLATIPASAMLGILRIEQLYVVAALVGVLSVFFDVADQSYLPTLVKREHVLEGNSKLQASLSVAEIGGPAISGALVQLLTAPIAILFDAVSFLFSASSVGLIKTAEPRPKERIERQSVWREVLEGLRVVFGNPILRSLALSEAARNFFGGFFAALYSLYAIRELGLNPGILGLVIGAGGASALVGALLAGRLARRFGTGPALIGSALLSSGTALLIPLAGGPLLVATGMMFLAQLGDVAYTVYSINEVSLRQVLVPDRLLGRANASIRFLVEGVLPIGALVGGTLGEHLGARTTLFISVGGMILASLWLLFSPVRTLSEQPQPLEQGDAVM